MSVKSAKQFRFMQSAKSGNLQGVGPSPDVAEEFLDKTPEAKKSQFAKAFRKKKK